MAKTYASPKEALKEQLRVEGILRTQIFPGAQYEAASKTLRRAVRKSPVDRRHYRNSWQVIRRLTDGMVRLVNDAPYSGVLEQGARPFWAPIQPLIEWAERKAGALALGGKIRLSPTAFRVSKAGNLVYKGGASLDDYDRQEVVSFAYAVRAKIAREGLPALWIMRGLLPYTTKELGKSTDRRIRALGLKGKL